jgi:succinate dehydrogenase / fumarate reductase, iron-sulfur subunit
VAEPAGTHEYTLRLRRYDPESGDAPYWDEHTIELQPHQSVLEGILQARARFDGSIGIRCSCRAAICGSCGVRINGQAGAGLPHASRQGLKRQP